MSPKAQIRAELEQLFELNCLFLTYLKKVAGAGMSYPGLPAQSAVLLGRSDSPTLARAAEFPQALFRLRLVGEALGDDIGPVDAGHVDARQSLQLTILLCAWHQCRHSVYAARLFLGLSNVQVRSLRTTSLSGLAELSEATDLLSCTFPESVWFWQELLSARSVERRRKLSLLGLQPKLTQTWCADVGRARLSSM